MQPYANPSSVVDGNAAPAFVLISPSRSVVAVSDALAQMLGYSVAELCGRPLESLSYWSDAPLDADLADQLFAGEIDCYEIHKRCETISGTPMKVRMQLNSVRDGKGKLAFVVMTVVPAEQAATVPLAKQEADLDEVEKIRRAMFW